jgi:hypothetical protein
MSEPTGPHGSLLVAVTVSLGSQWMMPASRTIAHLDLDGRIPLGNILQQPRQSMGILRVDGVPCTFTLRTTLDMVIASEADQMMCATPWVEVV